MGSTQESGPFMSLREATGSRQGLGSMALNEKIAWTKPRWVFIGWYAHLDHDVLSQADTFSRHVTLNAELSGHNTSNSGNELSSYIHEQTRI